MLISLGRRFRDVGLLGARGSLGRPRGVSRPNRRFHCKELRTMGTYQGRTRTASISKLSMSFSASLSQP
jgi:hypothetical protein